MLGVQFGHSHTTRTAGHHYTKRAQAQALPYWHQAGQRAIAHSAYVEARQHLTTGLEVLATVPETPARYQHELDLLTALALVLGATKSQAAPELEPVLTRAEALAQQVGEPSQRFGAPCARLFRARAGARRRMPGRATRPGRTPARPIHLLEPTTRWVTLGNSVPSPAHPPGAGDRPPTQRRPPHHPRGGRNQEGLPPGGLSCGSWAIRPGCAARSGP